VKKAILSTLKWTILITAVVMILLKIGGDFPTLASYGQPRLLAGFGTWLIVLFGLFSVMNREALKKIWPFAVPLAILWAGTFTWAYGFADLPEKKHLGDYYVLGSLLFSLPFLTASWTGHLKHGRAVWAVIQGLIAAVLILLPIVYISYYVMFGGEMDMFAMMAVASTHTKEIKDFTMTMASPLAAAGAVIAAAAIIAFSLWGSFKLMKEAKTISSFTRGKGRAFSIGLIVISILFAGGFIRQIQYVFPLYIVRAMHSKGSSYELLQSLAQNMDKNAKSLTLTDPSAEIPDGTHIVIVGESEQRDNMKAFTPSYPYNTTPWLSSVKDSPDFALGYKAYSNFPNTLMSLSYALTSASQYGDNSLAHAVSIVDAAQKAGYEVDWISFKNRSSLSTAGVTMIAQRSNHVYWEKNFDGYTVDVLKELPPAKKRIIFINIYGSHYTYLARVPVNERNSLGIPKDDPHHDYDLTVAYDDKVFRDIFNYAKDNMNLQSMVYFSDHGENMTHYHTTSPFFYDMVHIPFFVYLSPAYQAKFPDLMKNMKAHQETVFTNDLVFDTLSGIWNAKTNAYNPAYDWSSDKYSLTLDEAKTMNKKKMIRDDPALAQ
jgi:heptose-I-phosphate ethanolaminephosphotransferase